MKTGKEVVIENIPLLYKKNQHESRKDFTLNWFIQSNKGNVILKVTEIRIKPKTEKDKGYAQWWKMNFTF
jgi:hypothetical protein